MDGGPRSHIRDVSRRPRAHPRDHRADQCCRSQDVAAKEEVAGMWTARRPGSKKLGPSIRCSLRILS
jgi:hypothetical protein